MNKKKVHIRFGTSGWRAIIAEDFTFDNVRIVTQAIADFVRKQNISPKLIVGFDTRFLSIEFARSCANILAANKIKVLLTNRDTPTPVLAYHIVRKKLSGAINFTASHNPPEYNGIKFSPSYGGPAPEDVTDVIEKRIKILQANPKLVKAETRDAGLIKIFDPRSQYLNKIKKIVDIRKIKRARLKIAVDCMYGTSRGYIDVLLGSAARKFWVLNDRLNPLFGGLPPEPDREYITSLIQLVKRNRLDLGLACDGDADRFGIVDRGGVFLNPNEIVTLLFYYLLKTRGKVKRKVARTTATTHMIDAIAEKEGVEVVETPVGFKHIGRVLSEGDCLIGGEESGGLSIFGHVPEKDGILACMLIAEMVANWKKPLVSILNSLYKKYGYFYSDRLNFHLSSVKKKKLISRLKQICKKNKLAGLEIKDTNINDGFKFNFARNFWIMFRASGTESIVRCYMEAENKSKLNYLKKIAQRIATA